MTVGVATLGRQKAGEGRGARGWGWSAGSDLTSLPAAWRATSWVDWARPAGSQRAPAGAIVVAQVDDGVAVASLAPERVIVLGRLDATVAEALSLRGAAVWDAPDPDAAAVEGALVGAPTGLDALADEIGALVDVLWDPPASPAVMVVDLGPDSRWVRAFRVVADLVGLTSVAVGAGRVLDDRGSGPAVQLVDSDVAAMWSQGSGRYPVFRGDTPLSGGRPGVLALVRALIRAGSVAALLDPVRRSGEWDGTWSGLRSWSEARSARWSAFPVLPQGVLASDDLGTIAATEEGRAWLVEDALGDGTAWIGRDDAAASLLGLSRSDPGAHRHLATLVSSAWESPGRPADGMVLLGRLGRGLLPEQELARLVRLTVDGAPTSSLAGILVWANSLGVTLKGAEGRVLGALNEADEATARELFAALPEPEALALHAPGAPWCQWWLDAVEGAFAALLAAKGGAEEVVDQALAVAGTITDARSSLAWSQPDDVRRRMADRCLDRSVRNGADVQVMLERAVIPLLGPLQAHVYLDKIAAARSVPLVDLIDVAERTTASWRPDDDAIVGALRDSRDKAEIGRLLDLGPALAPLIAEAEAESGGPWVEVWFARSGTMTDLLDTTAGRLLLRRSPTGPWSDGRAREARQAFASHPHLEERWTSELELAIRPVRRASTRQDVIDRLARPVVADVQLDRLFETHLDLLPASPDPGDLQKVVTWVGRPKTSGRPWPPLSKRLAEVATLSLELARALLAVGVSAEEIVRASRDRDLVARWIPELGPGDDDLAAALALRMRERGEVVPPTVAGRIAAQRFPDTLGAAVLESAARSADSVVDVMALAMPRDVALTLVGRVERTVREDGARTAAELRAAQEEVDRLNVAIEREREARYASDHEVLEMKADVDSLEQDLAEARAQLTEVLAQSVPRAGDEALTAPERDPRRHDPSIGLGNEVPPPDDGAATGGHEGEGQVATRRRSGALVVLVVLAAAVVLAGVVVTAVLIGGLTGLVHAISALVGVAVAGVAVDRLRGRETATRRPPVHRGPSHPDAVAGEQVMGAVVRRPEGDRPAHGLGPVPAALFGVIAAVPALPWWAGATAAVAAVASGVGMWSRRGRAPDPGRGDVGDHDERQPAAPAVAGEDRPRQRPVATGSLVPRVLMASALVVLGILAASAVVGFAEDRTGAETAAPSPVTSTTSVASPITAFTAVPPPVGALERVELAVGSFPPTPAGFLALTSALQAEVDRLGIGSRRAALGLVFTAADSPGAGQLRAQQMAQTFATQFPAIVGTAEMRPFWMGNNPTGGTTIELFLYP